MKIAKPDSKESNKSTWMSWIMSALSSRRLFHKDTAANHCTWIHLKRPNFSNKLFHLVPQHKLNILVHRNKEKETRWTNQCSSTQWQLIFGIEGVYCQNKVGFRLRAFVQILWKLQASGRFACFKNCLTFLTVTKTVWSVQILLISLV